MGRSSGPTWTYVAEDWDERRLDGLRNEALRFAVDASGTGAIAEHVVEMAERYFNFLAGKTHCKTCQRVVGRW